MPEDEIRQIIDELFGEVSAASLFGEENCGFAYRAPEQHERNREIYSRILFNLFDGTVENAIKVAAGRAYGHHLRTILNSGESVNRESLDKLSHLYEHLTEEVNSDVMELLAPWMLRQQASGEYKTREPGVDDFEAGAGFKSEG